MVFASDMKVREILSKCGRIECQCGMQEVFSKCGRVGSLKSWLESELQGVQLYKSWLGATAHALFFLFLALHVST